VTGALLPSKNQDFVRLWRQLRTAHKAVIPDAFRSLASLWCTVKGLASTINALDAQQMQLLLIDDKASIPRW
jgi:hypothetical protein